MAQDRPNKKPPAVAVFFEPRGTHLQPGGCGRTMSTPPKNKGRRIIKINALTQAKLIEAMLDGVYNCQELADLTGLHYATVLHYTRELHRANAVHICQWDKDARGRDVIKIYKIGRGKDAKREKMTAAQRQARHLEKKKAMELSRIMMGGSRAAHAV